MKGLKHKANNAALTTVFAFAAIAGMAAFAGAPKEEDFKVRLTGVAVMPSDDDDAAKPKGFEQIKDVPNSYVVNDDVEVDIGSKIPLWLFGFLY